ncbi:VENN motif pre-toxin domain-containing protein [Pantoea piersonii]|uniref:VENN motif pre-toxin domain-containing protein n=1 Tax=Pantoea piersonii TaxID=2364647 RepID=UPI0028A256BA|nr:VENN motif pre-toxin domain-containing protein [Pantoea piersonii]
MYPGVKCEDLTEDQRQTISMLGTLAAGLAGGVTGDSTAGVVAGKGDSIRVYATWTILPDGSKRLSTVQTGAFK